MSLSSTFLFHVAMVTGGGLIAILSAGVWDFSLSSERHVNGNEAILSHLPISTFSLFLYFSQAVTAAAAGQSGGRWYQRWSV